MTIKQPAAWRDALSLLNPRWVLKQMMLALIVVMLSIGWLRLSDSNVLWVSSSLLLGLAILAVAGGGETALLLSLAGQARSRGRLLRGSLLLFVGVVLWYLVEIVIHHAQAGDPLRAGYYNSRFNASARSHFTYEHIIMWLGWLWTTLRWVCASVLGALFIAPIPATRPGPAIGRTVRSLTYWVATALFCFGGSAVTDALVEWTPGHGLGVEIVSVTLRLLCAFVVDAVLACLVLAVILECVRRAELGYKARAGTPAVSQPQTAEIP